MWPSTVERLRTTLTFIADEDKMATSTSAAVFHRCKCYLTNNIFLKSYRIHVSFHTKEQFLRDYEKELKEVGCDTEFKVQHVLAEIETEVNRRKRIDIETNKRKLRIENLYERLHENIYTLSESFFTEEFLNVVNLCKKDGIKAKEIEKLITEQHHNQRVYSFSVFTLDFCRRFLEEIVNFEESELPKGRPNTMNNYGVLLGEMGFDKNFLTPLRKDFLQPLSSVLFSDWTGRELDSHRAFVVTYKLEEDKDLAFHYDNAEVTLNVCLGKEFEGGELFFGNMYDEPIDSLSFKRYEHRRTYGLFHRGRHRHGAMPVESGERYNFIMWMRSSDIRNKLCPMCGEVPDLVPSSGFDDGFTLSSN